MKILKSRKKGTLAAIEARKADTEQEIIEFIPTVEEN